MKVEYSQMVLAPENFLSLLRQVERGAEKTPSMNQDSDSLDTEPMLP
jgi:hypothetical protein